MNLRFRSKAIRNYEKENNCSIFDMLEPSIDNLVTFIQLGMGCDEDKAFDILDMELEQEGKDTIEVLKDILMALQKYGFFPKKVCLEGVMKQIETSIVSINSQLEESQPMVTQPQLQPVKVKEEL